MSGLLGLSWSRWARAACASWVLFVAIAWTDLVLAWSRPAQHDIPLAPAYLALVFLVHAVPGLGALLLPSARARLPIEPGAAALSSMTLAALAGIGAFAALDTHYGAEPDAVLTSAAIGALAFPLTLGLAFPLCIPLACGAWVWSTVRQRSPIGWTHYSATVAAGACGWFVVALVGQGLGSA